MKIEEFRALSTQELVKQLEAAHHELFELRLRVATKQLANHREVPRVKKNIARLNTIIREKELNIR